MNASAPPDLTVPGILLWCGGMTPSLAPLSPGSPVPQAAATAAAWKRRRCGFAPETPPGCTTGEECGTRPSRPLLPIFTTFTLGAGWPGDGDRLPSAPAGPDPGRPDPGLPRLLPDLLPPDSAPTALSPLRSFLQCDSRSAPRAEPERLPCLSERFEPLEEDLAPRRLPAASSLPSPLPLLRADFQFESDLEPGLEPDRSDRFERLESDRPNPLEDVERPPLPVFPEVDRSPRRSGSVLARDTLRGFLGPGLGDTDDPSSCIILPRSPPFPLASFAFVLPGDPGEPERPEVDLPIDLPEGDLPSFPEGDRPDRPPV